MHRAAHEERTLAWEKDDKERTTARGYEVARGRQQASYLTQN
jgi:hypothetical protein